MARVLDKRVVNPALDVSRKRASSVPPAAPAHSPEIAARQVDTKRFGPIDVDPDLVIEMLEGMIGFENCREYVVVRHDDKSAFRWLQSLEKPDVAFPVVEPFSFRPDYAPTISDTDARILGLKQDTPTLLFVVVSVPGGDPRAMTANLLAPIVINGLTRHGKQVIIQDEGYGTKHEVVKELQRAASLPASSVAVTQIAAAAVATTGSTVRAA